MIKTTSLTVLLFTLMIPSGVFAYASGNRINTALSVFDNLQPVSGDPETVTPSGFPPSVFETSRQGFDRDFTKTHPESTPQKPGMLLGFELKLLNFCIRSGIRYTDPWGLRAFYRFVKLWPAEGSLRFDFNPCLPNYWLEFVVVNKVGNLSHEAVFRVDELVSNPDFMSPRDETRFEEVLESIDSFHKSLLRRIAKSPVQSDTFWVGLLATLGLIPGNDPIENLDKHTKGRLRGLYPNYWH